MVAALTGLATRARILISRLLVRMGFQEDSILMVLAFVIGILAAAAAVGFHELIQFIRNLLYAGHGGHFDLYGSGMLLLVLFPALGGLAVGMFSQFIMRQREGHGIVDVLETVLRSSGHIKKRTSVEKILTSAITIGTGGSAGAEGPIVQIGASISSAVAQLLNLPRHYMPVLIGCGSAAGISAIFNAPIGGLLFTLEVILRDFSLRAITPVVVASVVANFTTRAIFQGLGHEYSAIFDVADLLAVDVFNFRFAHLGNFLVLGLMCGVVGVAFTRTMHWSEAWFSRLSLPRWTKPAMGAGMMGLMGAGYILMFRLLLERHKPFAAYDMPAFYSDGYDAVKQMLTSAFYADHTPMMILLLLGSLIVLKIVATALTLSSGGSGGIIAPSLFLGAVVGGFVGTFLHLTGWFTQLDANLYALIGISGVLAAVVHAPLAAILILFEATREYDVVVPAMLCAFIATSTAQLLFRDSIYTLGLRLRGVHVGTSADLSLLRRITVDQVLLEPATFVRMSDPFQHALDLMQQTNVTDFVVVDKKGYYAGMLAADEIKTALMDREAIPLLTCGEIMRAEIPTIASNADLATVLDRFSHHEINRLPVVLPGQEFKVIGLVSRSALMKQYQRALHER